MPVLHQLQPSFNNGEISPLLYDRVDYQKFTSSVKSGKNMFVHPQGGMSNRAGTLMLGNSKDEYVRLIPFEFSNTETYMIEFGDFYCRFYTTNGQVVNEDGSPYEIASPFATADLDKIRYVQSGDVMYLAWGGKPKTLTRYGHTDWRFADYDYKNGPYETKHEFIGSLSSEEKEGVKSFYLNSFDYNFSNKDFFKQFRINVLISSQSFSSLINSIAKKEEAESKIFLIYGSYSFKTTGTWGGTISLEYSTDLKNWETKESFSSTDGSANYDYAGSFDMPSYIRLNLSKLDKIDSSGLNFSIRNNASNYYLNVRCIEIVSANKIKINTVSDPNEIFNYIKTGETSLPFLYDYLTSNTSSPAISVSSKKDYAYMLLDGIVDYQFNTSDFSATYTFSADNVWMSGVTIKAKGSSLEKKRFKLSMDILVNNEWVFAGHFVDKQHLSYNWHDLTINFGNKNVKAIKIYDVDSTGLLLGEMFFVNAYLQAPSVVEFNFIKEFFEDNKYPTDVELYQDRIGWATNNQIDATKISDYTNFGVSTEVTDDDAISVIIKDKKINKINSAIAGSKLVVFTDSGNFIHNNDTFTPNSATFLKQGSTGGADVKPVIVRDNIIYVHPMKQAISDYAYSFETDGYAGQDITILANHLFENKKIKTLAYQQEPYSIIWVLQEEGTVLACTYLRQQNVIAWTPMDFGGKVLSIGVLSNGSNEELYLAVQRKNGTFVEKMPTRLPDADPKERFFVDCGRTYRGEPANIISGLDHLEGENVVALADGKVVKGKVVTNGQITLDVPASIVTVGLPYESVLETLTFDVSQGDGSNLNRKKRVVAVSVRYNNSRGSRVSVNGHREVPMLERKIENTDTDISLKSGFYREILPSAHKEPTTIKIRQDEPLPITIVSIIPELEYEQ